MAKKRELPLHGPAPAEIPLPKAPLVSVIAQVRFPTLLTVPVAERIIGFQEAIRDRYPYLNREDVPTKVTPLWTPAHSSFISRINARR
jgi:uncharacterized protein (TIGR04255 family)